MYGEVFIYQKNLLFKCIQVKKKKKETKNFQNLQLFVHLQTHRFCYVTLVSDEVINVTQLHFLPFIDLWSCTFSKEINDVKQIERSRLKNNLIL